MRSFSSVRSRAGIRIYYSGAFLGTLNSNGNRERLSPPRLNQEGEDHEKNTLKRRHVSSGIVCVGADYAAAAHE